MGLPVRFHCKDGEIIAVYDLISSNRQARYQSFGNCAFRLSFDEIEFVTLPES